MKLPKMILFDYGQTLVSEQKFDGVKGTEAVLEYATQNKYHLTAEEIQREAAAINEEFGRYDPSRAHLFQIEVPNSMFTPYLYESLGIEVPLSTEEVDRIFWDAAAPGTPTDGMADFLAFLKKNGIRTGVISNIAIAQKIVAERINALLPNNTFEFIITSSNYIFRKPHQRIFKLALEKAGLPAEDVWYIGDSFACDVKGALGVGMTPVWYIGACDQPHFDKQVDVCIIEEWRELEKKIVQI